MQTKKSTTLELEIRKVIEHSLSEDINDIISKEELEKIKSYSNEEIMNLLKEIYISGAVKGYILG